MKKLLIAFNDQTPIFKTTLIVFVVMATTSVFGWVSLLLGDTHRLSQFIYQNLTFAAFLGVGTLYGVQANLTAIAHKTAEDMGHRNDIYKSIANVSGKIDVEIDNIKELREEVQELRRKEAGLEVELSNTKERLINLELKIEKLLQ